MSGLWKELFPRRKGEPTMGELNDLRRWIADDGKTGRVSDLFPEVSASRGGIEFTPTSGATYTSPFDPVDSGAVPAAGDLWVDTGHGGRVKVADGRGGWADRLPEGETDDEEARIRKQLEAAGRVRSADEEVRLGDHSARRRDDGDWVCSRCGGESADAGVLAETGCDG